MWLISQHAPTATCSAYWPDRARAVDVFWGHLSDFMHAKVLWLIVFALTCALHLQRVTLSHSHVVSMPIMDWRYLSKRFWRFTSIWYSFWLFLNLLSSVLSESWEFLVCDDTVSMLWLSVRICESMSARCCVIVVLALFNSSKWLIDFDMRNSRDCTDFWTSSCFFLVVCKSFEPFLCTRSRPSVSFCFSSFNFLTSRLSAMSVPDISQNIAHCKKWQNYFW